MEKKSILIEHLSDVSKEDFSDYGQIIGLEDAVPLEDFAHLNYWTNNISVDGSHEQMDIGLLLAKKMDPGFQVTEMERHPGAWEIFFPLEGQVIFVMAPVDLAADGPDLSKTRAFLLDGSLGVALPNGNWHWPPIPVGKSAKLSILRIGNNLSITDTAKLKSALELVH